MKRLMAIFLAALLFAGSAVVGFSAGADDISGLRGQPLPAFADCTGITLTSDAPRWGTLLSRQVLAGKDLFGMPLDAPIADDVEVTVQALHNAGIRLGTDYRDLEVGVSLVDGVDGVYLVLEKNSFVRRNGDFSIEVWLEDGTHTTAKTRFTGHYLHTDEESSQWESESESQPEEESESSSESQWEEQSQSKSESQPEGEYPSKSESQMEGGSESPSDSESLAEGESPSSWESEADPGTGGGAGSGGSGAGSPGSTRSGGGGNSDRDPAQYRIAGIREAALQTSGAGSELLVVLPGDTVGFALNAACFSWEDASGNLVAPGVNASVLPSQLRSARIGVKATVQGKSGILSKAEIVYDGESYVRLTFADYVVETEEREFTVQLSLTRNGVPQRNSAVNVAGVICNEEITLSRDDPYVDLSGGAVAVPQEFVPDVEADLGEAVIRTHLYSGKKYYGVVTVESQNGDATPLYQYPDIELVYTARLAGFGTAGNKLWLRGDGTLRYVYDQDMIFVGMSDEALPPRSTYYLSSSSLTGSTEPHRDVLPTAPKGMGRNR